MFALYLFCTYVFAFETGNFLSNEES